MHDPEIISEVLKKHLGRETAPPFGLLPARADKVRPQVSMRLIWGAGLAGLVLALIPWGRANEIHSADPAAVRGWVKTRTGETFALRNGAPPDGVRLTGAYLTGAAAVVTFAVAGRPGTVRMVPNAVGRHRYLVEAASAEDEKQACMLCHGTEVN